MDVLVSSTTMQALPIDSALVRALTDDREALLVIFEQALQRMNHLEQLLLAFATLGLTGWGFLHASPFRVSFGRESDPEAGRVVFAFLFSAIVSGAFNVMFLGRMASNIRVIDLEGLLLLPVNTFANYSTYAGGHAKSSLIVTALFIPIIALCSIFYTAYGIPWRLLLCGTFAERLKAITFSVVATCCLVTVVYTTIISIDSIERWEDWCNGQGTPTFRRLMGE